MAGVKIKKKKGFGSLRWGSGAGEQVSQGRGLPPRGDFEFQTMLFRWLAVD